MWDDMYKWDWYDRFNEDVSGFRVGCMVIFVFIVIGFVMIWFMK